MDYSDFKPNNLTPLYMQVMSWFDKQVETEKLKPSDRIPSTDDLAKALNIGRKVIQQALAKLSERGMLERRPGRGTFLSRSIKTKRIALVFPSLTLTGQAFGFFRLLCNDALQEAERRGYKATVHFVDTSKGQNIYPEELLYQIHEGRVMSVMTFCGISLKDCPLPCIVGGTVSPTNIRESMDFRGLSYLSSRGFTQIAIVIHGEVPKDSKALNECISEVRQDHSADLNIKAFYPSEGHAINNKDWIMDIISANGDYKPEALLILDDNLTRDAIFSLLKHGIKIPEDIAILSHTNKGSLILSPVELTRLEMDTLEHAQYYFDMLDAKLAGTKHVSTQSRPRFVVGKSCGE